MADPDVSPTDLFEAAPCGYVVLDRVGVVVRANREFLRLVGRPVEEVEGVRTLDSLLTVGGRVMWQTHLAPILLQEGVLREVALDLAGVDGRVPVLVNATRPAGKGGLLVSLVETRDRRRYEDDLRDAREVAETVGRQAAALAETLQQTLIPPRPPTIPHLDLHAAYRPAGNGREVGGDFYDVFQVTSEEWVVVLGDVCGKGIPAAVVTTFVRHHVRALAVEHADPAELLAHLDAAMCAHRTERYCTLVVVRLARSGSRWWLDLSLAGHPAALVRRRDGHVSELGVAGTPVGLVSDARFETVRHELGDETVTLYTDGVTEARGVRGLYGDDRLRALVSGSPHSPRAITDSIAAQALGWQAGLASDDIAVLTFGRSEPEPAVVGGPAGGDEVTAE